jgi:hypothetical protein
MSENPKHYAAARKVPFNDIPMAVVAEVAMVFRLGANKYGAFNYRKDAVRVSDYVAALKRHLTLFEDFGQDIDPESLLGELSHMAATAMVLRDAQLRNMMIDDRPPPMPMDVWERLQDVADGIAKNFPKPKPRVTARDAGNNKTEPVMPVTPYMPGQDMVIKGGMPYAQTTGTPVRSPAPFENIDMLKKLAGLGIDND